MVRDMMRQTGRTQRMLEELLKYTQLDWTDKRSIPACVFANNQSFQDGFRRFEAMGGDPERVCWVTRPGHPWLNGVEVVFTDHYAVEMQVRYLEESNLRLMSTAVAEHKENRQLKEDLAEICDLADDLLAELDGR